MPTAATPLAESARAPIAVVGAGLMGHGIAQVFALAGHRVRVHDPVASARASVRERIARNLGELGEDAAALERISVHTELAEAVADAYAVFEAGPENLELKRELFVQIEAAAPPGALLASNTSVIPITQIMGTLARGERALGTHWWNPPYLIPLVEVIRTARTSETALRAMTMLLERAGKTPVRVEKDVPGFVGNRLQHALWREAIALVANGVCDAQTVDTVVKASFGRRLAVLGPLENADLVGTDLTLAIHETVLADLDRSTQPSPYLRQLVAEGRLGMKSGSGFRRWSEAEQLALRARVLAHLRALAAPDV
jgi:3-hydroxybutyryl-CoA dehydrogenase